MTRDLTQNFVIRSFDRSDQISTRSLILQGLGEHFGFIDETMNPDLDDIYAHYIEKNHLFFVVQYQTELVGTGALRVKASEGQLVRMSVAPDYRRRGIGRFVVQHLLAAAKHRKLQRLIVETNKDWYNAIGLYQACGFTQFMEDDVSVYLELLPGVLATS